MAVEIEYDPEKRDATLKERGLDMADAALVFEGDTITVEDARKNYGEPRYWTIGFLKGRMVFMVWTPRGGAHRIISMRKTNERETEFYTVRFLEG